MKVVKIFELEIQGWLKQRHPQIKLQEQNMKCEEVALLHVGYNKTTIRTLKNGPKQYEVMQLAPKITKVLENLEIQQNNAFNKV